MADGRTVEAIRLPIAMSTESMAHAQQIHLGSEIVGRDLGFASQAASPHDGEEPRDVRRRGRQRADDRPPRRSTPLAGRPGLGFEFQITFWLWLTVLFANFAEAMAEGRGKAQADTLRKARTETVANRIGSGGRTRGRAGAEPPQGRSGDGQGGRVHPRRRRNHRRRRLGRRVGDHRGVGAGHPGIGRRPIGGDRRHDACCRTGSRSASRRTPAIRSWTG